MECPLDAVFLSTSGEAELAFLTRGEHISRMFAGLKMFFQTCPTFCPFKRSVVEFAVS